MMRRRSFHFLACFLVLSSCLMRGQTDCSGENAANWTQLKLGMSAAETVANLGQPLIRTGGRGFETWTYDRGAEVLMFGSLIGWTMPGATKAVTRSKDIWGENRAESYFPTFLTLLPPPPAQKSNAPKPAANPADNGVPYLLPIQVYRRR